MKHTVEEKSSKPLYKDFTANGQNICWPCDRKLSTGTAIFLLTEGRIRPFGPACARKYASSSVVGIPDLTKHVHFDQEDETDDAPKTTGSRASGGQNRQIITADQRETNDAVRYALLRERHLTEMGLRGLTWAPLTEFLTRYEQGQTDPWLRGIITKAIRSNEAAPERQHLTLQNLEACYVYARIIDKTFADAREAKKRLVTADYERLCGLYSVLRKELYLTPDGCAEIVAIAKRYQPNPPTVKGAVFRASRPKPQQKLFE